MSRPDVVAEAEPALGSLAQSPNLLQLHQEASDSGVSNILLLMALSATWNHVVEELVEVLVPQVVERRILAVEASESELAPRV